MRESPSSAQKSCVCVSTMFRRSRKLAKLSVVVAVVVCGVLAQTVATDKTPPPDRKGLKPILDYIGTAWDTLTRSMTDCQSLVDPKMKVAPVLYLPAGM